MSEQLNGRPLFQQSYNGLLVSMAITLTFISLVFILGGTFEGIGVPFILAAAGWIGYPIFIIVLFLLSPIRKVEFYEDRIRVAGHANLKDFPYTRVKAISGLNPPASWFNNRAMRIMIEDEPQPLGLTANPRNKALQIDLRTWLYQRTGVVEQSKPEPVKAHRWSLPRIPRGTLAVGVVVLLVVVGGVTYGFQSYSIMSPSRDTQLAPNWVSQFIGTVNAARESAGVPPIQEDRNLTLFAVLRFVDMAKNFEIAGYGFRTDEIKYFGIEGSARERVLHPNSDVTSFVGLVKGDYPDIWNELVANSTFHFGYFLGDGPSEAIIGGCSLASIPLGTNSTQYLLSHGCQLQKIEAVWLVFEFWM